MSQHTKNKIKLLHLQLQKQFSKGCLENLGAQSATTHQTLLQDETERVEANDHHEHSISQNVGTLTQTKYYLDFLRIGSYRTVISQETASQLKTFQQIHNRSKNQCRSTTE